MAPASYIFRSSVVVMGLRRRLPFRVQGSGRNQCLAAACLPSSLSQVRAEVWRTDRQHWLQHSAAEPSQGSLLSPGMSAIAKLATPAAEARMVLTLLHMEPET